ncbi:MAG: hypothetical protein B7Z39_00110 [Novosphingobium sp. 12-64-8]|nr:MAG: hypothetical protein B7Z39_00110 [Novosphingobium sp. 12-64-8]
MTENKIRPDLSDGENAKTRDLAPEVHNEEQDDEGEQAQSVADEAIGRATTVFGSDSETDHAGGDTEESGSTPDLVDHMKQMVSSGRIDMSAFRGERSDDDEEGLYGEGGIEDDTPRGAE